MYTSTSEPCVGFLHLAGAFPRLAAVIGCLAVGTTVFPILTQRGAETCLAQSGAIHEMAGEGSVCVIDPVPLAVGN